MYSIPYLNTYSSPTLLARNSEATSDLCVAWNSELPLGPAPEWVELLPAGGIVEGIDGRRWINDQPEAVLARFQERGRDMVLDWEHATQHKAPQGDEAPASAWCTEMQIRNGAIWGRVSWTPKARAQIESREYRFLSPVFEFTRDAGRIVRMVSAGLTNTPNLALTALNRAIITPQGDFPVWNELKKKLGLPESATEAECIAALNQIQADLAVARNREATPSLDKYVPRADFDNANLRATNAEQQLQTLKQAKVDGEIETAINQALEAGKIAPATVEYHKAQCRTEGGLERFNQYVETAPAITTDSGLDKRTPTSEKTALNAEAQVVTSLFGNSIEDLKKYGGLQ